MRKMLTEVLADLKNSLRDLESLRMTPSNDPSLRDLKRDLRKMIKQAKDAARESKQ
jgi:hypothetical protein